MALSEPFPTLPELLASMGEAGQRMNDIEACEGAAGNISICVGWPLELGAIFPNAEPVELPLAVPALAGMVVLVSGSGQRLRDIQRDPAACVGAVAIDAEGRRGTLHSAPQRAFARVTSEFNSHLAVHHDQLARGGGNFHALIHAQPPYLTYLSQIAAYRDEDFCNRRLLRWEPETIINLPEGIGVLPFLLPGSPDMMEANVASLRAHQLTLWSKHGLMARSDAGVLRAADRIDYIETAARYEYMDMVAGGRGEGLSDEELRAVVRAFDVPTTLY
ncbi:rhamnulose-1-phosphate aldolase [Chloroflexia bacterium SDU3-3]|nr:rhamnulose-1-phosphate aldolase [Chloroflexia bacterium SDU3-3]